MNLIIALLLWLLNPSFATPTCQPSLANWTVSGDWSLSQKASNPTPCGTAAKWHAQTSPTGWGTLSQTVSVTPGEYTLQYDYVSMSSGYAEVSVSTDDGTLLFTSFGGHLKTWRPSPVYSFTVPKGANEITVTVRAYHGTYGGIKITDILMASAGALER